MTQPKLKLIFQEIKKLKSQKKIITDMYRDALNNDIKYPSAIKELERARNNVKLIKSRIMEEMKGDFDRVDDYKEKIKKEQTKLSDAVLYSLINDQDVNFKDDYDNEMEPIVKVTYKKV